MPAMQMNQRTTGMTNFGTDGMREQLYALQITEQEAAAKYTAEHPKMQEIRRQVVRTGRRHRFQRLSLEPAAGNPQGQLRLQVARCAPGGGGALG